MSIEFLQPQSVDGGRGGGDNRPIATNEFDDEDSLYRIVRELEKEEAEISPDIYGEDTKVDLDNL